MGAVSFARLSGVRGSRIAGRVQNHCRLRVSNSESDRMRAGSSTRNLGNPFGSRLVEYLRDETEQANLLSGNHRDDEDEQTQLSPRGESRYSSGISFRTTTFGSVHLVIRQLGAARDAETDDTSYRRPTRRESVLSSDTVERLQTSKIQKSPIGNPNPVLVRR